MSAPPVGGLPRGFAVRLDRGHRRYGSGRTMVGGSRGSVLRLRPEAAARLGAGDHLVVDDGLSSALARALLDRGLAHPVWRTTPARVRDVTVVVPVRDRCRALARLLAALGPEVPVVVVDDGSQDPAAVAAVAAGHGARLVRHARSRGPAAARNSGLAEAVTEFVAFVDSDVVPVAGWLGALRRHFTDPRVGAVGARVLGMERRDDDSWLCRYEAARSSLDLGPRPCLVHPHSPVAYLPSAALMVRSAAVRDGFDTGMRVAEDVDLVWRVQRAGWRVRYEPAALVRHEHRTRLGPWLARKCFYGTGAALLAERHGRAVAPMVLSPWTAALSLALLAQRRWSLPAAALLSGAVTARVARRLGPGAPVTGAARLTCHGGVAALHQTAAALTRHYWPVVALAATRYRRVRRAVLVAAVVEAELDRRRTRPDLDPVRYLLARRLDDLGYGAGLWVGALRRRSVRALLPALSTSHPSKERCS